MTRVWLARRVVSVSVALVFNAGLLSGQNETATAVVDFDLAVGDQAQTSLSALFAADDIIQLEVRAVGVDSIIAHQFRLSFDSTFFDFVSGSSSVDNGVSEANMLKANGGSIFLNTFTSQVNTVGTTSTLLFAVTLDGASQTQAFSVSGNGLMGVVGLRVKVAFAPGSTTQLTLVNAKFVHHTNAANENAIDVTYDITNGNQAPGDFTLLAPAGGSTVLVNWDDDSAVFSWNPSADPDAGDVVQYTVNFNGTSFSVGTATSFTVTGGELSGLTAGRGANAMTWYVDASDGIATTSSDTFDVVIWNNNVLQTITDVKGTLDADLIPSTLGDTVKTSGVVSHDVNFLESVSTTSYFIQEGSIGLDIFAFSGAKSFRAGDQVEVAGTVNQFNGLTDVEAEDTSDVRKVGTTTSPLPLHVASVADFLANAEANEGLLVRMQGLKKMSGTWPSEGSSANLTMYDVDSTITLILRIDRDTDIDGTPEPNWDFRLPVWFIGLVSQFDTSPPFDTGYQLWPRGSFDIFIVKVARDGDVLPTEFGLAQNFPNPFNPSTTIQFSLPRSGYVTLTVYNTLGAGVATLVSETLSAGRYSTEWDASRFSSGVYFYRLQAGEFVETKKVVLLR